MNFVLATANAHKADEMRAVLSSLGITVSPRPADVPDVDETAPDLEGNALLKARALVAATGQPAVADDTGLFVDALGGDPGVRSARYDGDDATDERNRVKLLREMNGVTDRSARFRTVIAVAYPDGLFVAVEGALEGVITEEPRGTGGFGYDALFAVPEAGGVTLAEMSADEKNALSHRARALVALAERLGA
jgi:XTP/dITP diphosphohydrolase